MPKLTHFQFKSDDLKKGDKTGLSAVYDANKMSFEEVKFDFQKYRLVLANDLPNGYQAKPGEIYVTQTTEGLEVSLYDTNAQPAGPIAFPLKKLGLDNANFTLTQKSFDEKVSNKEGAKTLKQNLLRELFVQGFIIQPFNLKFYKATPADPKEKPFLVALTHAKSGSEEKDKAPRSRERKELNRISKILQKLHPECTHLVWAGDVNEPAYLLKDGVKKGLTGNDLQINTAGLTTEAQEVGGDNLVLTDMALPSFVIDKVRIIGARSNAQTDKGEKGDEGGNNRLSAKARAMVFEFRAASKETQNENAQAIDRILQTQVVPEGEIRPLHSGKTSGSDHGKTGRVRVNGITLDVRPLLETAGARGFHSYEGLYKAPYDDNSIKLEQASALKLTELMLLEMGKTQEEINNLDFKAREKLINVKKTNKNTPPNPLVEELTPDWEQNKPERLYKVLKDWINSPEKKAENDLLAKKPELETEADIPKIFKEYLKKSDGRILDAIFRAEQIELSAGFTYLPNPRPSQLASYDDMVGSVDLRLAAGDGPNNHEDYEKDMLNVCHRLDVMAAAPKRLSTWDVIGYTVLGVAFGACVGTALASAIGFAAPVVLGIALGSAALLGLSTLAYVLYRQSPVQKCVEPEAVAQIAPAATVSAQPSAEPAQKPALTFSDKVVRAPSEDSSYTLESASNKKAAGF